MHCLSSVLRRRFALAAFALLLPLAASAQQLTVSAAASLTDAFKEIKTKFEAAHPGVTLFFNFGASGALVKQIIEGAPADVFASADQASMDLGVERKLIDPATRRDFVSNSVVLIVPAQGAAPIAAVGDLAKPEIKRIAIGNPESVPVGRYTKEALESAKLWTTLGPKFVPAANVRQVLDYVARGEVEAGFVYRTDAAIMRDKVKVQLTAEGHKPVTYPVAVVSESKAKPQAQAFVDFLFTPPAREILDRYGFSQPK